MDFITWATSPWGQSVPIHIAWYLIWVMVIAGLLFMIVHALYVGIFAAKKTFAKKIRRRLWRRFQNACPGTRLWRAHFTG